MIPIKNKKKTLETTINEMRNFSFSYVKKYAPSKQQLKIYLLKKYLKSSIPSVKKKDIIDLIDLVISDLEKTKLISEFGSTACKALYKCNNCLEAFDYFKCI